MKLSGTVTLEFLLNNFDFEKSNKQIKQGFIIEGGSGAAKTWDVIQFLIYYCQRNENKGKDILISRFTNADLQKTVLKDFIKILLKYNLYNEKNHYKSSPQHYNLFGNVIYFSGMDAMGSHGERHDIIWVNEMLETEQQAFQQLNQRCNEAYIGDYNPSFTDHWVYNSVITRPDCKFFLTTCLQNPYLPEGQRMDILAYEPTAENIKNGTADDYMWKVYGLGLRAAAKGLIFQYVDYIDELPDAKIDFNNFGLDFGFTCFDENTLISTLRGQIPIKDVTLNDFALTRSGYKKVLKVHNNGIKKVVHKTFEFDFGYKEIICTFDHNFKTENSWKQLKYLQKGDKLNLNANLMGKNMLDTQTVNIQTISSIQQEKRRDFMLRFGNSIMDIFQKVKSFITLTKIRLIIKLRILCLFLERNTQKYIQILKDLNQSNHIQKRTGRKEEPELSRDLKMKKENVNIVAYLLLQLIRIKDFVLINVIINGNIKVLNVMNYVFVKIAGKILKEINILNQKLAQQNAPIFYQEIINLSTIKEFETIVYDLTIEDCHEYFANGILVHNCDPTCLTQFGLDGNKLYAKCLLYEPIDNAPALDQALKNAGIQYGQLITADCSDKYNDTEMVAELRNMGWYIKKVNKGKGINWRIGLLKKHKICLVRNVNVKREQENYKWREINGICINEPVDKFNHFWDSLGYGYLGVYAVNRIIMHG